MSDTFCFCLRGWIFVFCFVLSQTSSRSARIFTVHYFGNATIPWLPMINTATRATVKNRSSMVHFRPLTAVQASVVAAVVAESVGPPWEPCRQATMPCMTADSRAPVIGSSTTTFSFCGRYWLILLIMTLTLSDFVDGKVFSTQMSRRVVTTRYGRLRGILIDLPEPTLPPVEAYLGIEYGSLLGGELRFLPPTSPVARWEGVRTALKFKPVCPQPLPDLNDIAKRAPASVVDRLRRIIPFLEQQQEDCLFLNVYVPVRGGSLAT